MHKVLTRIHLGLASISFFGLLCWLLWSLLVAPWRDAYRQLPELRQARGIVREVAIRHTSGRDSYYYLGFTLAGEPQRFGIRSYNSRQPLTVLQRQLRRGQPGVVYYEPNNWLLEKALNSNVYQVEVAGVVVYPWAEAHQHHLSDGRWGLVFLCAIGLPILYFSLRRLAS